jgi:hypothetical protein
MAGTLMVAPVSYCKAPSLLPNSEEEICALASRLACVSVQRLSRTGSHMQSKALKLQQSRSIAGGAGSDAQMLLSP